jgi:putative transposase
MARPLRIEYPGAVYHLTSRGNAQLPIYEDTKDRLDYFEILEEVVARFNWVCHAYCLMDNHYHLLIETPDGNLSGGMRQLNGVYTQRFNIRHYRAGHIYQGRFKSILVEKQSHLLELCRYVVLNPVRANMAKHPGNYRWSSYKATAGITKKPPFLAIDWILKQFGKQRKVARQRYRKFVQAGMDRGSPWEELKARCILGSKAFIEKIAPIVKDKSAITEIPREQRYANRAALEELFSTQKVKSKEERNSAIHRAYFENGYSMTEIAQHIGLHYTTISKIISA